MNSTTGMWVCAECQGTRGLQRDPSKPSVAYCRACWMAWEGGLSTSQVTETMEEMDARHQREPEALGDEPVHSSLVGFKDTLQICLSAITALETAGAAGSLEYANLLLEFGGLHYTHGNLIKASHFYEAAMAAFGRARSSELAVPKTDKASRLVQTGVLGAPWSPQSMMAHYLLLGICHPGLKKQLWLICLQATAAAVLIVLFVQRLMVWRA